MTVRIVSGTNENVLSLTENIQVLKLNISIILKTVTMKTIVKLLETRMFYYVIYCACERSCAVHLCT